MRRVALIAVLLLAGCTDTDWHRLVTIAPEPEPSAGAVARLNYAAYVESAGSRTAEQECARTARDRARDTGNQGFGDDLQRLVYDGAYTDCMTWAARTQVK
ncbi:MAG: hypothetical protein WDN08_15130 [Rhizomicrobium sp.]